VNQDVFISYSREDQQQVNRLVGYLREQGLNVWMDETDIHGATMWTEEIVEAIHGCTLFILAISSHSTGSKNVVKELALASEREKKILPLYLEESQIPKNMEYQLAGIQNIALYTLDKAKAYEFVHQTIRRLGVGQTQPDDQALGQAAPAPTPGHGTGHMPPPKAKGNAGKWIAIAAGVVVLAVAGLFLINGGDKSTSKTPMSTAVAPAPTGGTARIALLPIEVNAPSEDDQWVGGGMGTQLRAAINKLDGVTIISGVSVNAFRGTNRDINKIRENLNVNYILDCEIAVVGETVTAVVEFINANNSQAVWSKTYEDGIDSIFNIKSDIAAKIANSIGIDVESATASAISNVPTASSEAFKLYTQGRTLWLTRSQAGMKQSIKLYEQAIKLDDQFALAYAGIADAYNMLSQYGHLEYDDGYPKARKYVLEAITRNPDLAEAYISLGWIQFAYEWKLKDSEKSYRKAIQLNPKIAQAHQWLGINLNSQLQYDEAYNTYKRGLELDPNHPVLLLNFSNTALELDKFDEAIGALNKGFSINPNFKVLWSSLYQVLVMKGDSESDISELINEIETLEDKNESIYAPLTHYYRNKDNAKFDRYLKEWKENNKTRNRSAFPMFKLYEVGIDNFIEQAEIAYENNRLAFGFTHGLFLIEHRDNPNYIKFVEKISKGK
jgi:TolB-like protein/tetratricopeptide (TPR) repeat protein